MKNALLLIPLLFASCATITRGVHEKLKVVSDPPQANVLLSTGETGITPATFVKNRRTDAFTVTVSKAGYVSQSIRVESKFSGTGGAAMAGNAIVGGLIGIGVDAASGAYNSLYPNPVSVHLIPKTKSELNRRSSSERRSNTPAGSSNSSSPPPPSTNATGPPRQ
jgi:hypothetical protein